MDKEKLCGISRKLTSNRENFIAAFRKNLFMYSDEKDITLKEIAENADIPFSTLNSFLYGSSKDIKLSTAVKLAHALDVSIDELVGADTLSGLSRESIAICRSLPENAVYLIRWYIRYIDRLNSKNKTGHKYVSIMEIDQAENGNLKMSTQYKQIDITNIPPEVKSKVFFGITMPCDRYMPTYSPYDILLIANDRSPKPSENSLLQINKYLFIAKRRIENGVAKYYSIRDGKFRCDEDMIDENIGYIAYVYGTGN